MDRTTAITPRWMVCGAMAAGPLAAAWPQPVPPRRLLPPAAVRARGGTLLQSKT